MQKLVWLIASIKNSCQQTILDTPPKKIRTFPAVKSKALFFFKKRAKNKRITQFLFVLKIVGFICIERNRFPPKEV